MDCLHHPESPDGSVPLASFRVSHPNATDVRAQSDCMHDDCLGSVLRIALGLVIGDMEGSAP